ncbi:MAG: cytochrome P450 [Sphingomonadales bacterium]|nr:cytochrome P450 [Sphingomonadales bacterium]
MQRLTELDLPDLPLEDPAFSADPFPYIAAARRRHPWAARCGHGIVIHGFSAIKALLWRDGALEGSYADVVGLMGAHGTPWGRFQEEMLLARQGDAHKRIRGLLAPAFTPRQAARHRPLMRAVIAELLDAWAPKGAFDFEEFAAQFPIGVMCSLIGAPRAVIPELRASLEALGLSQSLDRAHLPALQRATGQLDAFVQELVAGRRAAPREEGADLLQLLVDQIDRGGLTERELHDLLIFLFVAGYDTSKNALTLAMAVLVERPDLYARCAEDPAFCRRLVEENFRYLTTSTIPRIARADIVHDDVLIPRDTMLFFPVSIAGRDGRVIDDPDRFDPDRRQIRTHMAFGMGAHICLGQFIARAQIEEDLHQIARRLRNPRRTGPSQWRPFYGVWGLRGLPIAFDAGVS